jgi:hypothetical protein
MPTALRLLLMTVLIAASVGAAWLFRLDAAVSSSGGVVVTDRWLGKVYYCGSADCQQVYPK